MAIALVQQTTLRSAFNSSSLNFNFSSNITAGNLAIISVSYYDGDNDIMTVTAGGETPDYTYDLGVFDGQRYYIYIFQNTAGGSSAVTISSTGSSYIYAHGIEFSGLATASVVDKITTTASQIGLPLSGATGTLTQANNLAVSWTGARITNSPSQYAAPTGWTMSNMNVQDWDNASTGAMCYFVTSATTSLTPAWLGSTSSPHIGYTRTVVLKEATGSTNSNFSINANTLLLTGAAVLNQTQQFSLSANTLLLQGTASLSQTQQFNINANTLLLQGTSVLNQTQQFSINASTPLLEAAAQLSQTQQLSINANTLLLQGASVLSQTQQFSINASTPLLQAAIELDVITSTIGFDINANTLLLVGAAQLNQTQQFSINASTPLLQAAIELDVVTNDTTFSINANTLLLQGAAVLNQTLQFNINANTLLLQGSALLNQAQQFSINGSTPLLVGNFIMNVVSGDTAFNINANTLLLQGSGILNQTQLFNINASTPLLTASIIMRDNENNSMSDYMVLQEFRMLFPEFRLKDNSGVTDNTLQMFLDAQKPYINKSVFKEFTKMAHGIRTAKSLANSPYSRSIRKVGSAENYKKMWDNFLLTVSIKASALRN